MRSFWFYISCTHCLLQVCLAIIIVYYWHTTFTYDGRETHNLYGIVCSVVPKKYRILAHVLMVFFFTLVFYAFMDHFYDFCLDPEDDSYATFQKVKEYHKKNRKKKAFKRYVHPKKPKQPVILEDPVKDWRPPLNGDQIIRENIEDLYMEKLKDTLRSRSSPRKYSPKIKSPKRQ
ncbi:uncharacterized protein LOC116297857 [Actinia tenebrosa]|uniref:Uncharacterized protein LOC116297857 n=1 Tax=Actinia tenebrosa TaxID=6105 RepID=A0A6P8IA32_ACTTE|nr:uncharacterized protein LOC116297857 [Actinia tenebrosa]